MSTRVRLIRPDRVRLTRPDGANPDGFYRAVAEAYLDWAASVNSPCVAIAEEADVPAGTARRWVLEARRRGHLPAARKGTARPDPWPAVARDLGVSVDALIAAVHRHSPRTGLRPRTT